ncbi:MAG: hypothetical protein WAU06_00440 [Candidatus Nanopelagicales bacterium]
MQRNSGIIRAFDGDWKFSAPSCSVWSSIGVNGKAVDGSRLRAVSPDAQLGCGAGDELISVKLLGLDERGAQM